MPIHVEHPNRESLSPFPLDGNRHYHHRRRQQQRWRRQPTGMNVMDGIKLKVTAHTTPEKPGKRMWLPIGDGISHMVGLSRGAGSPSPSTIPVSYVHRKQSSKKQIFESQKSSVQPVVNCVEPCGRKLVRLENECRSLRSDLDFEVISQHQYLIKSIDTSYQDSRFQHIGIEECALASSKFICTSEQVQRDRSLAAREAGHPLQLLPVHDGEPHTPLSDLKWPFGDLVSGNETFRGGGGGTQAQTTGSSGFPQFVTAGPACSLTMDNLFGYDRDALSGGISWA